MGTDTLHASEVPNFISIQLDIVGLRHHNTSPSAQKKIADIFHIPFPIKALFINESLLSNSTD